MEPEPRPRVLYILGAGHCGSTLLGMLMNGHARCVAVSELSKLSDSIAANDPVLETPEWQATARCFEARSGTRFADLQLAHPTWRSFAAWSQDRVEAWARPRAELLACLSAETGRRWIVDGSKSWQPLYLMDRSRLFDLRVLHLVRDARAVVHSYAKKYGELRHGLTKWMKSSVTAVPMAQRFAGRWLRVRYEDLGRGPVQTLTAICALLGESYDPQMLRFRSHRWLGVGGNRMARGVDETIRLDERWQREMPRWSQVVVDLVGGAFNRYYGY